jgi:hypothetical protein
MSGRQVYLSANHMNTETIDISNFTSGLYTLKIETGAGTFLTRTVSIIQ